MLVTELLADDIRFPTSSQGDGSDAIHTDPDYSCVYVRIRVDGSNHVGHGLTFTIGRGTEVVLQAVLALKPWVLGADLSRIYADFGHFWHRLTNDSQLRWIGPEKGAVHLATAAVVNALWDLWAKLQAKPLWQLLVDMEPEQLVRCIDFSFITDALSPDQALELLRQGRDQRQVRQQQMLARGYPAYTTGVGWVGYDESHRRQLCREALRQGYRMFKAKVGTGIPEDRRRLAIIREEIGYGPDVQLMVDANQKWEVAEAIDAMKQLAEFRPRWIEEPTSPDDVAGHATIARALAPYGIKVATGEQCQNRIMFKQFMASGGMQYCQVDACRLGGLNEVLAVCLLARKMSVPVCPHAGGVGLCEYVQHVAVWDYVALTGTTEDRVVEYVPHLSEYFEKPAVVRQGHYMVPEQPGYCCELKPEAITQFRYPEGTYWSQQQQQQKETV